MPKAAPHPDTEISHKKYGETTIGELRRTYGADFAEGCADHEKLVDVLRKLPSLRGVIRCGFRHRTFCLCRRVPA
jgi:hypothetical protein